MSIICDDGGITVFQVAGAVVVEFQESGVYAMIWSAALLALELKYLLVVTHNTTKITFKLTGSKACNGTSCGTLRVTNKPGYSNAVKIP